MNNKAVFGIALSSLFTGFVTGAFVMNKTIVRKLKETEPLLRSVLVDVIKKAVNEDVRGDELTAYLKEQMEFFKIVIK